MLSSTESDENDERNTRSDPLTRSRSSKRSEKRMGVSFASMMIEPSLNAYG